MVLMLGGRVVGVDRTVMERIDDVIMPEVLSWWQRYRYQISAHDTSSCEKVDFLIVDATVFCSSTTEVKPKLSKKICRAPTLARPSNGY